MQMHGAEREGTRPSFASTLDVWSQLVPKHAVIPSIGKA
jgi:hypothetical protein